MKYPTPSINNIWAEAGAISVPSSLKISEGWVSEIPPCEQANFIENRQDKAIVYFQQMGVSEWVGAVEYQQHSYVNYNGVIYKSSGINTNKQPNIYPLIWEIAFDDKGSADVVQQELDALILEDDPFDQYALKDAAVFTAKANGTSFSANTGLPTDNLSDVGHSFVGDGDSGMFKSGSDLVFTVDAIERARVKSGTLASTESSTALATTEWVKQLIAEVTQIKIGDLYFTSTPYATAAEVAASKGYGTWQRYAEGRAIVGFSSDTSSLTPDWLKIHGNTFGELEVKIAKENIPNVDNIGTINLAKHYAGDDTTGAGVLGLANRNYRYNLVEDIEGSQINLRGDGKGMNNVQPSIVVSIWKRVT